MSTRFGFKCFCRFASFWLSSRQTNLAKRKFFNKQLKITHTPRETKTKSEQQKNNSQFSMIFRLFFFWQMSLCFVDCLLRFTFIFWRMIPNDSKKSCEFDLLTAHVANVDNAEVAAS